MSECVSVRLSRKHTNDTDYDDDLYDDDHDDNDNDDDDDTVHVDRNAPQSRL